MSKHHNLRTFYTLLLTQTFSLVGSQMTSLAIGIKVFNDTDQATPLAMVAFFAALPRILSASLAGVLSDRWDRRYVMMISDLGQAVGTLLLLVSFATGAFELWHLYVVALIQAVFGVFQQPAFQASVTMLVPDEHRDRANAIQQLTGPASGILAPIFAGVLFSLVGATGVMTIDLITFLVAVLVVFLVHIPRPEITDEGRANQGTVWFEALAGFRYLRARPVLLSSVLYVSLVNFLIGGAMVLDTPYILRVTGSEALLGTLLGASSVGALVGGMIMSAWGGTRPRIHTIMPGIALAGVFLAIFGMMRHPVPMGASLFLMMLPIPMVNAAFMSIMQLKTPPDMQGRVFAALNQISMLLMPLAFLVSGPLADNVVEPAIDSSGWEVVAPLVGSQPGSGIGLIMVIAGAGITIATLLVYASPAIRQMEVTLPDYHPVEAQPDKTQTSEVPATPATAL